MAEKTGKYYLLLLGVLAILVAGIVLYVYSPRPSPVPVTQTSQDMFVSNLQNTHNVAIAMNITNVNSSGIRSVFTCGTDLAYSLALLGKNPSNLKVYVLNESRCTDITNTSKSAADCLNEINSMQDSVVFFIGYGYQKTTFEGNYAIISTNESYSLQCKIAKSQQTALNTHVNAS